KACLALRYIEVKKDDRPRIIHALASRLWRRHENEAAIRYEAILTLRQFASDAAPEIPALVNCTLDRTSWETRHMAAATLWLAAIDKYLKPTYPVETRIQAVQALAALGTRAKSRLPQIVAMLDDREAVVVDGACLALVRMGDTSDKVTDPLISLLEHKDPNRV